jgi:hypothetical protein
MARTPRRIYLPVAPKCGYSSQWFHPKAGCAWMQDALGRAWETALSCGYSVAQYFGWQWVKLLKPAQAPRFQLAVPVAIALGVGLVLTTLDPIKLTEYAIVRRRRRCRSPTCPS